MGDSDDDDEKEFLLKRQGRAYAGAASIHGLCYIAEKKRPYPEK